MNRIVSITTSTMIVFGLAVGVSACSPGNNTGGATVAGAAIGGLALGGLTGSWLGGALGAVVGGVVGNVIGQRMDRNDWQNAQYAVQNGQSRQWTNPNTHYTYTVSPVGHRYSNGRHVCRKYKTTVYIAGKGARTATGVACRGPNGQWKI